MQMQAAYTLLQYKRYHQECQRLQSNEESTAMHLKYAATIAMYKFEPSIVIRLPGFSSEARNSDFCVKFPNICMLVQYLKELVGSNESICITDPASST